jgi:N-terminal half of MaoC dehydratase
VPDYSWAEREDWESAWNDVVALVGADLGGGRKYPAADPVEAGAIRRYLEPLEFGCPLHYDEAVARKHGYVGIVAPYSGLATWISPGLWADGDEPVWVDPARNAQPRMKIRRFPFPGPDTNSMFQTDVEHVFHRPIVVGDRLYQVGQRLLQCLVKETRVGRGAFMTWEVDVRDDADELVATIRPTVYPYVAR